MSGPSWRSRDSVCQQPESYPTAKERPASCYLLSPLNVRNSSQRKPCPACGSTARRFKVVGSGGGIVGGCATVTFRTYPEVLLRTARTLIDAREFSVGVVLAP